MKMLPDFAQRRFGDAQFYWGQLVLFCNVRRNRPQGALLRWQRVLGVPEAAHLPIRAAATGQYPNPAFNGVTWRFVLCSLHQGKPEPYG